MVVLLLIGSFLLGACAGVFLICLVQCAYRHTQSREEEILQEREEKPQIHGRL